jgi:peptidoglycan/LPS O-acetylase OafA/YrhL
MRKILYLEGLRGVAAFIVVIFHLKNTFLIDLFERMKIYFDGFLPSLASKILVSASSIFFDGGLAVNIFWILSAYVISIKLFSSSDSDSTSYVYVSAIKRYFRLLYPCLISVILSYMILVLGLMRNVELADKFGHGYSDNWLGSFYTFQPNLILALKSVFWDTFFNYSHIKSYNAVLWTMTNELYGSLFCFGLYGITRRQEKRFLVYFIVSLVCLLIGKIWLLCFLFGFFLSDYDYSESKSYFISWFKSIDGFIKTKNAFSLILFLIIVFWGRLILSQKMSINFVEPFIGIALVYLVVRTPQLNTFFGKPAFIWLGKISFSLYLIHMPIICSFTCWVYFSIDHHWTAVVVSSVSTILISLVFAVLFYNWVDKKSVLFSNKVGRYFYGLK